jgi:hypothetical protein
LSLKQIYKNPKAPKLKNKSGRKGPVTSQTGKDVINKIKIKLLFNNYFLLSYLEQLAIQEDR